MSGMDILAAIDAAVGCQQCGAKLDESVSDDFCGPSCQADWHAARAEPLTGYREPWDRPWDFPGVGSEAAVSVRWPDHIPSRRGHTPLPSTAPGTAFIDQGNGWEEMGRLRDGFTPTSWIVDEVHTWPVGRITPADLTASWTITLTTAAVAWRLPRSTGDLLADWRALGRAEATASTDAQRAACALRRADLTERHTKAWAGMAAVLSQGAATFAEQLRATWESIAESVQLNFPQRWICGLPLAHEADHTLERDVREQALHARRNRNTGPPAHRRPPRRLDAPGARR